MVDMKQLAHLMRELEDQLMVCMRCGMCQAVCPVFSETGRESDVARGKLALLDGLLQEMFKDPKGVQERLMRCLLCGSCAAACPSGVRVLDIFFKARAILTGYMGLSPLKKAIFRSMLAQPEVFNSLLSWGARLQGFFVQPVDELLGTSCARFMSPLGDRHFRKLAPVPFHEMVQGVDFHPGKSGLRVAFFVGCLVDKIYPNIGKAVVRSLEHLGVGVSVPAEQGCCGIPALSAGDTASFVRLLRYNLELFSSVSFDYLVTACATCSSTIQKLWPLMAAGLSPVGLSPAGLSPDTLSAGDRERLRSIAERTVDVSQLLSEKLGIGPAASNGIDEKVIITYHDPCHLKKSLGVGAQPRAVIRANPRYRLQEMAEADRCCGCGGSFNLRHYGISEAIGRRKRANIVSSGAEVVATGCPACMLHISDMLSKAGDRIQVKHAMEIYAESLEKG